MNAEKELIEYYYMISQSIKTKERELQKLNTEIDYLRESKGSIAEILNRCGYRLRSSGWEEKTRADELDRKIKRAEMQEIKEDFGRDFIDLAAKELGRDIHP